MQYVLHFDLQEDISEYLNRVGRTARLNKYGVSVCMVMDNDEKKYIEHLKKNKITVSEIKRFDFVNKFILEM